MNPTMNAGEFADYLAQLLGRSVAVDSPLTLSSGQQARVAGWLTQRGFPTGDLRARLSVSFTASGLLGESFAGAASAPSATSPTMEIDSEPLSVGIDIQNVDELVPAEAAADFKSSAELLAIFTLRELSYAQSRPDPAQTLGGLFAAKEALRKCSPALLAKPLVAIEVLPDAAGRPEFPGFAVSISHSGGFAAAVAARLGKREIDSSQTAVAPLAVPVPQPVQSSGPSALFNALTLLGALVAFALAIDRLVGLMRF